MDLSGNKKQATNWHGFSRIKAWAAARSPAAHACLGFFRVIRANSWPAFFHLFLPLPLLLAADAGYMSLIMCSGCVKIGRTHYTRALVLFGSRLLLRYGGAGCGRDMHLCPHPEKARTANEAATAIGLTIMNVALPIKLPFLPVNIFCRLAFKL